MALSLIYREPGPVDTDISGHVVLRSGQNPINMASNAEERSVGAWTLDVEDALGEFQFNSQRTFYALEDEADDPVIGVWQTEDKGSHRGDLQRTGTERTIGLNLIDLNTLLERRVIREGDGGNRPAETDYERMIWLQGTGYIGGGTDWIFDDFSAAMDANDFTGRMVSEIIEDCMGQSGANCYMFRDPDTTLFTTYYGDPSSALDRRTSELRISNIETDIDADAGFGDPGAGKDWVWAASLDTEWNELSTRVYGAIFGNYDGGAIFEERAATVAAFSHRDTVLSWPDVKSEAKARARAIRMLDTIRNEEHRITTSIEVSAAHVNDALQGERIQCRFSHFPPYVDWTWMRILNRAVTWLAFDRYRIQFELSATPPPTPASCATSVAMTESTSVVAEATGTFGPVSIPVSAASFDSAMQIGFFSYVGPLMGLGGCAPLVVGGGWTLLVQSSGLGDSEWVAVGYLHQPTIATPANMTVSATCSGGGFPFRFGHTYAFPSSDSSPVQQSPITGTGNAVLPSAPTVGNLLYFWSLSSETGADTTQWLADGGTILVDNEPHNGTQWWLCIGVRCVNEGEDETIRIPTGSHATAGNVSEWVP